MKIPSRINESIKKLCAARQMDLAADAVSEIMGAFCKKSSPMVPPMDIDNDYYPSNEPMTKGSGELHPLYNDSEPRSKPALPQRPRRSSKLFSGLNLKSLLGLASTKTSYEQDPEAMEVVATPNLTPNINDFNSDGGRGVAMRRAFDLATTLERIEKNFVITDPRLPDNPIVRNFPY